VHELLRPDECRALIAIAQSIYAMSAGTAPARQWLPPRDDSRVEDSGGNLDLFDAVTKALGKAIRRSTGPKPTPGFLRLWQRTHLPFRPRAPEGLGWTLALNDAGLIYLPALNSAFKLAPGDALLYPLRAPPGVLVREGETRFTIESHPPVKLQPVFVPAFARVH